MAEQLEAPSEAGSSNWASGVLVVVGASAGGLAPLRQIVTGLPEAFPGAICVVQHVGDHESHLVALLDGKGPLPVIQAQDGAPILRGRIYIAPPSHHLIVGADRLHLTRGPRENFARPAVDPLFRSAAEHFRSRAIGVILTGQLSDGTAGLYEIKRRGGIAVVQDPDDAESPGMPKSAINHVAVDHLVAAAAMPALLSELASRITKSSPAGQPGGEERESMDSQPPLQRPVALTCPECGGALRRSELGTLIRFDCHIGHSITAEAMVAGQFTQLETGLEVSLRRMNERTELCRQMGEIARGAGDGLRAEQWDAAQLQSQQRSEQLRQVFEESWIQPQA